MNIKTIILDDESASMEALLNDIQKLCPSVSVEGTANDLEEGYQLINKLKPQLAFLDINIKKRTIFELLEKIKNESPNGTIPFHIIFTTAHDKYAVMAFKFSASDYLLKPVDPKELVAAVSKVESLIKTSTKSDTEVLTLLENFKSKLPGFKKIVLATSDAMLVQNVDEIIRLESEGNYTKFFFKTEKPLLISKTMKDFEDILKDQNFERLHNSHLVNVNEIKKFVKSDGGYVIMSDGASVPVAQRKRDTINRLLSSM